MKNTFNQFLFIYEPTISRLKNQKNQDQFYSEYSEENASLQKYIGTSHLLSQTSSVISITLHFGSSPSLSEG